MKISNARLITGLACVAMLISGCSKDALNHLTTQETQIYITDKDSSTNFTSFKTYSVSDSVAVINNGQEFMALTPVDSIYLAAVNQNMQAEGYTKVSRSANPDLGVNVSRVYNTATGVISYGDYWDYYGDYYNPYYWGYGGYGYYVPFDYSVYQITEGALSVDMLDLKDAASNKQINVVWTGLIRGEGVFNQSTASSQVQALFAQSPYLKN